MRFLSSLLLFSCSFSLLSVEMIAWKEGPPSSCYTRNEIPVYTVKQGDYSAAMTYACPPLERLIKKNIDHPKVQVDFSNFKDHYVAMTQKWFSQLVEDHGKEISLWQIEKSQHNSWVDGIFTGKVIDGRRRFPSTLILPFRTSALLLYKDGSTSTAYFISPNTLLTADSGVMCTTQGQWTVPRVVAAADGDIYPFGIEEVDQMFVTKKTLDRNQGFKGNIGIIVLKKPLGLLTGFMGMAAFSGSNADLLFRQPVEISGYPRTLGLSREAADIYRLGDQKKISLKAGTYMGSTGQIRKIEDGELLYDVDTSIGQSGSPLSAMCTELISERMISFGVHTSSYPDLRLKKGTMFTPDLLKGILDAIEPYQLGGGKHPINTTINDWPEMIRQLAEMHKEIYGQNPKDKDNFNRQSFHYNALSRYHSMLKSYA